MIGFRSGYIMKGSFKKELNYFTTVLARNLSGIEHYVEHAVSSIREMHRQTGNLVLNDRGIAVKGLIIRHLLLPGHRSDTFRVIDFITELSCHTYTNLMVQYGPVKSPLSTVE